MLDGMGKTSVYLPRELAERVRASGVPMAELIRRGLDAGEPPALGEVVRAAVREELQARCPVSDGTAGGAAPPVGGKRRKTDAGAGPVAAGQEAPPSGGGGPAVPAIQRASDLKAPPRCPHKGVRQIGGWCATCQADVKPGGRLPDKWVKPQGWAES